MAWNGSFQPLKSYIECGLAVSRSRLETAALPTELYPCICVKLFSLQAFLPARSIIPQTHTKSQDFLKNSVVKSAIFWKVRNCRNHIGRYSWRNEKISNLSQKERCLSTSFSLYWDHCSYTPQKLEMLRLLGLRCTWAGIFVKERRIL